MQKSEQDERKWTVWRKDEGGGMAGRRRRRTSEIETTDEVWGNRVEQNYTSVHHLHYLAVKLFLFWFFLSLRGVGGREWVGTGVGVEWVVKIRCGGGEGEYKTVNWFKVLFIRLSLCLPQSSFFFISRFHEPSINEGFFFFFLFFTSFFCFKFNSRRFCYTLAFI